MNKKDLALLRDFMHRDNTGSSHHLALLRGLAEITVEFDHLAQRRNANELTLPLGLLVWKWALYYFPIAAHDLTQATGTGPRGGFLAGLRKVTLYYRERGGCEAFCRDLRRGGVDGAITRDLIIVLRRIRDTLEDVLQQSGAAAARGKYRLLCYNRDTRHIMEVTRPERINLEFLIQNFGTFNIRRNFYEALRGCADFITGTGSVIYQWARFTAEAGGRDAPALNHALAVISTPALRREDTAMARGIYEQIAQHGVDLRCVWTGRTLDRSTLAIDHVIPFSLVPNNDLWNLMPCHQGANLRKGECIPSASLLSTRARIIQDYWALSRDFHRALFDLQFRTALAGFDVKNFEIRWAEAGLTALKARCRALSDQRGGAVWSG